MNCSCWMAKVARLGGAAALAALLLVPVSVSAQNPATTPGRVVRLRIETEKSTYHGGDSIRVRVTLKNTSNVPVEFYGRPPVVQARLYVRDAKGERVSAALPQAVQDAASARPLVLGPGVETTLSWRGREWLNLRDWGYDLGAGRYTIVGLPVVAGLHLMPDHETVRSNAAAITILQ